jgi:hypothetical protein
VNIRYWLFRKGWVVILPITVAILAIWVWPNLYIPPVFTTDAQGITRENPQTLYLLSSIAQSLAAILALVFTLSLITLQLSSRYSQRLIAQFFNKFTIIYIIVFVISIFLPLWTIVEPYSYIVKISLSLAAVCLFLLIPYFLDLRERLSPEKMLQEFREKTMKIIHIKPTKRPEEIVTLDNFVMSAFASKDYETCRIGVDILADLAYEAHKERQQEQDEEYHINAYSNSRLMVDIYKILMDIASSSLDDPRVPQQIITAIWGNAVRATKEGLGDIAEAANNRLAAIGLESTKRGNDNVTEDILGLLGYIAREALRRNISTSLLGLRPLAESCMYDIVVLSEEAIEARLPHSTEAAVHSLSNMLEDSLESGKGEISEKCLNRLLEIINKIPYGVLKGEVGRIVCRRLFQLGILFRAHQYEQKQHEIIRQLKNLEGLLGSDFVKSSFDKIPKYWFDKWEKQIIQFRDIYDKSSKE